MDLGLSGRVAIVTGASFGIGAAIAEQFAAEGAALVIAARRAEPLEAAAARIRAKWATPVIAVAADVTDDDTPARLLAAANDNFRRVDILVNNAGTSFKARMFDAEDIWEASYRLNFVAVRRLTQHVLPVMMDARWGRIINITGPSEYPSFAREPGMLRPAHAAKAAVHMWSKNLAMELGSYGVTVNCLAPGAIVSEQLLAKVLTTAEERDRFASANIPVGRLGQPEDVAGMVAFMASEGAGFLTGEVVNVDGGMRGFPL
jgi:3-oxoacyl-[acyl-carrier protein] reductase